MQISTSFTQHHKDVPTALQNAGSWLRVAIWPQDPVSEDQVLNSKAIADAGFSDARVTKHSNGDGITITFRRTVDYGF